MKLSTTSLLVIAAFTALSSSAATGQDRWGRFSRISSDPDGGNWYRTVAGNALVYSTADLLPGNVAAWHGATTSAGKAQGKGVFFTTAGSRSRRVRVVLVGTMNNGRLHGEVTVIAQGVFTGVHRYRNGKQVTRVAQDQRDTTVSYTKSVAGDIAAAFIRGDRIGTGALSISEFNKSVRDKFTAKATATTAKRPKTLYSDLSTIEKVHLATLNSAGPGRLWISFEETQGRSLTGTLLKLTNNKLPTRVLNVSADGLDMRIRVSMLDRRPEWVFTRNDVGETVDFVANSGWDKGCELTLSPSIRTRRTNDELIVTLGTVENAVQKGTITLHVPNQAAFASILNSRAFSRGFSTSTDVNNLAWLLATSRVSAIRNGTEAIKFAQKACELTDWENPIYFDTLAAAYAEAANFSKAIEWQEKALASPELPKKVSAAEMKRVRARLQLYKDSKPYRE